MPRKKGADWRSKVFYDADSSGEGQTYEIADRDLKKTMAELCVLTEEISSVRTCKVPLSEWQLSSLLFYHEFVLFETPEWWWTIEKDGEGIHIQRSKDIENVRDRFDRKPRLTGWYWKVTEKKASCKPENPTTLKNLIEWLWDWDELNRAYHVTRKNNCQDLALRVYEYVKCGLRVVDVFHWCGMPREKGADWKSKVFYDSEASGEGQIHEIADRNVKTTLKDLCDLTEEISSVTTYRVSKKSVMLMFYTEFVLLKTCEWWWTIDKHGDRIYIQRSKNIENVRDRFNRETRNGKVTVAREGHSGTEGGRTLLTYFAEEGVFFQDLRMSAIL